MKKQLTKELGRLRKLAGLPINESYSKLHQTLNEYFVREDDEFSSILVLNVFNACIPESMSGESLLDDPVHGKLARKYSPRAMKLYNAVMAQSQQGRTLTGEEAEMIEDLMYDGTDMYDDDPAAMEDLEELFINQLKAVQDIL
jgi:hypothetical protein